MRPTRRAMIAMGLVAALGGGAGPAVGHVDVLPTQVVAGEAQRFTVRVPSERDIDTVRVRVLVPDEILVYSVKPAAGWAVRIEQRPDQRTGSVTFSGGAIGPGQFQEFEVLGTPQEAGTAVWRSEQIYADGVVKRWTGPPELPGEDAPETAPDAPGPASATSILVEDEAIVGVVAADSGAAIWLGVIAIAIAAGSALGVGLLWSTRPARLPEDD